MNIRSLVLAVSLFMFVLGFGGQASAYSTPPSWMPMTMLDISFDSVTNKLAIVPTTFAASLSTNTMMSNGMPTAGIASFDPAATWGILNNTAFSRRFGWNDANEMTASAILTKVQAVYGSGAYIWIQSLSKSPGLNTYLAVGNYGVNADGTLTVDSANPTGVPYSPIFGTDSSSAAWKWDGMMDHNTNAVPFSYLHQANQTFSNTYKIYIGDSSGVELPTATSASTTTTWSWQGPAFVFPTKINQAAGAQVVSGYVDLAFISGLAAGPFPITITGGEYSIWTPAAGWGAYTNLEGTITNQDSVRVRLTASATAGATTTATVAIAALTGSGEFKVITAETAGTLAPITFTSLANVEPSTLVESTDSYTVNTITGTSATAGVSTGSFAVSSDGGTTWGPWLSVGTVVNGDKIKVRFTSSGSPLTAASTKLTIVGVAEGTFAATTNSFSGPPTWMPMTMLNISLGAGNVLAIQELSTKAPFNTTPPTYPVLSAVASTSKFDPAKVWSALNGSAYSRRLGWNPAAGFNAAAVTAAFGPTASIWIEKLSATTGFETYQAVGMYGVNGDGSTVVDPTANGYAPIFGTAGSSTKWKWDYMMDHNTNAVPAAYITTPNQLFTATYKIYVGDAAGVEIPTAASASTTTTWTWQGPATVPDTTPDAFSFTSQTGVTLGTVVESVPVTVAGIDASSLISITGGEYAVSTNGGASWSVYSATNPVMVANGNQVKVRQTSSAVSETTTTATLTIGGVSAAFDVTTGDSVPATFSFTPVIDGATSFATASNVITVAATTTSTPLSISGGTSPQYSVSTDGGTTWSAWSATTPATVALNNQVKVRQTSSSAAFKTTTTTLSIGGVTGSFSVTTGYANPPSWMPMAMLNVAFDSVNNVLTVVDESAHTSFVNGSYPVMNYVPAGSYDATKPWGVLNGGVAISRQLGWDDNTATHGNGLTVTGAILGQIQAVYGASAGIWIERVSQSPGLETYFADGMWGVGGTGNAASGTPQVYTDASGFATIYDNNYNGIFGTSGSSTKWKWDGTMIHNVYAVPVAYITQPNQLFTATYKVYVGDSTGTEILNTNGSSTSTTEVWSWKGPATAFGFTSQPDVATSTLMESNAITVAGITSPAPISITGGEYAVSTDNGSTWSAFSTTTPATVTVGNQVKVHQTSSATAGTATDTTLTIGVFPGTFTVTTVKRNGSGGTGAKPTVNDALKALQAFTGAATLTPAEQIRYDVAPISASGVPVGNGTVDVADVIMILRRSIDIGSW